MSSNIDTYILEECHSCEKSPGTVLILKKPDSHAVISMFLSEDREKDFQTCLDAIFDYFEFTENKIRIMVNISVKKRYKEILKNFKRKMCENNIEMDMGFYL